LTKKPDNKRAAIYARISSDRDGEALGVERQLEDCRKLCAGQGWATTEYVDNNLSASKRDVVRPEYNRLVNDIENGRVDVVVVWDIDRLTRRPLELEQFAETCEAAGMTEDIHSISGPMALFEARLKGVFAAEEARKTSLRGARKKLELAQAGKPHGGSRAFGYEKDGMTLSPVEAELIKDAAARVLRGESLHTIRRDWHDHGVKTASGKLKWSVSTLKRILTSPRVAGLRVHQGEILEGVETAWPAILDRETWDQVCVVLTDPKRFTGPRTGSYPLSGVLTCGLCGEVLKAMPRQGTRSYGCKKDTGGCNRIHIRSEHIEKYLFDLLLPMADSPDLRDVLRAEEEGGLEAARELVLANAEDEKMLSQLSDDYADRLIDRPTYLKQSQRLRERIGGREAQLTVVLGKTALSRLGGEVRSDWEQMSAEDKRAVLRSLVDHIKVNRATNPGSNRFDPGRLNIVFRYDALAKMVHLYKGANGNWRAVIVKQMSRA
jgi:DNA invertase Pin-like site-specific DNA recombinase